MEVHQRFAEPWRVTLVDTGERTQTGGRLRHVREYVAGEEAFCFTYGDGVGNVDVTRQLAFHRSHGKLATLTAVQPPGRFGSLELDGAPDHPLRREAARRRGVDQRRVLRPLPAGDRPDRRPRHGLGAGAAAGAGRPTGS